MNSKKGHVQKKTIKLEETMGILESEMEGLIDEIDELKKQRDALIKVNVSFF